MPVALMLAMQAAGMIVDYIGTQNQIALGRLGAQAEQSSIEANMEASRLQYEDESLREMRQLRQNLGTQAAIQAARGTFSGAGSAASLRQNSIRTANEDERSRRINLMSRQANLRAQNVMSSLHQSASESQLGQALGKRIFNNMSTSPDAYSQMGKDFGFTSV